MWFRTIGLTRRLRARWPAGPRRIRPEADFQLRNSFSFSNLFYKLQFNLIQIKFEFQ
jgi:hypothetical protein